MAASSNLTIIIFSTLFSAAILLVFCYFSPLNQKINDDNPLFNYPTTTSTSRRRLQSDQAATEINNNLSGLERVEEQLARARGEIRKAILLQKFTSSGKNDETIYKNPDAFHQSHIEMMKTFKIWTYKEGEFPLVHSGPMRLIYALEGQFIVEMERADNPLAASHHNEAHAFFIPISVTKIVQYLYMPGDHGFLRTIELIVEDYIRVISNKYPYWNRSSGADHFFVSCHDWGPFISRENPKLFKNLIRVLCNANTSEGFIPSRDVSMSEIYGPPIDTIPHISSGQSPYSRPILAFFAGGNHGTVRSILFQHWGNNQDKDIRVHTYLPEGANYTDLISQSRFCLCPSGLEVSSARITEAIHVGCVPVIIKEHFVLPYDDVLDWSQFSVVLSVEKIPDLKRILQEIPFPKYLELQKNVMRVQRHFTANMPAKPFDLFHMILHSVWLRRLNVRLQVS